jgi:hypothetical protein
MPRGYCEGPNCTKRANYGLIGDLYARFCKPCAPTGCEDISHKKCAESGCTTRPTYNYITEKSPLYCVSHKKTGMEDITNRRCIEPSCKKQPHWNYPNTKQADYCYDHKKDGMVDVNCKKCAHIGCNTRPCFNVEGTTTGKYCFDHRNDDGVPMINVVSQCCEYEGCKKQPTHNYAGIIGGRFCAGHQLPNMENVRNPRCIYPGCKTQPTYGYRGSTKPEYCEPHHLPEMIDVKHIHCQYEEGCDIRACFGLPTDAKPSRCVTHQLEGMENIVDKCCKNEWCNTIVTNKYEGYCLYCFIHMFPDRPVARNFKTKESATVSHVLSIFPNFDWRTDRTVPDGCSRRRPDLYLDLGYQVLMVEIDENQHVSYDCSCENKRIMELSQDVGHRPIIFIRFNPDDYMENGTNTTSCWTNNKLGLCTVKKSKNKEWTERLLQLTNQIEYWTTPVNQTDKTIEIVQLFYDVE